MVSNGSMKLALKICFEQCMKETKQADTNVTKVHSNLRFRCILEPSVENNRLVAQLETFCAKLNGLTL